jgi:exosortase A-associated hydrolase 2
MNRALAALPQVQPFFLPAAQGQRFCLFHPPRQSARGALLYVHPFAEEMNKTRRMAALQARSFAQRGYGVLQIDLCGCGDSSGDFSDARWDLWKQDMKLAFDWLAQQRCGPISLWGLRLGALLALDFSADAIGPVERLILWQPVLSGKSHLNQFLRMRMASQMLTDAHAPGVSNASLRAELAAGSSVEVAGYELSAELAGAIDEKDAATLAPHCPTYWFESTMMATATASNESADGVTKEAGNAPALPPAVARSAAAWHAAGAPLHLHPLCGVPFWATTEIAECPALLAATDAICS